MRQIVPVHATVPPVQIVRFDTGHDRVFVLQRRMCILATIPGGVSFICMLLLLASFCQIFIIPPRLIIGQVCRQVLALLVQIDRFQGLRPGTGKEAGVVVTEKFGFLVLSTKTLSIIQLLIKIHHRIKIFNKTL